MKKTVKVGSKKVERFCQICGQSSKKSALKKLIGDRVIFKDYIVCSDCGSLIGQCDARYKKILMHYNKILSVFQEGLRDMVCQTMRNTDEYQS